MSQFENYLLYKIEFNNLLKIEIFNLFDNHEFEKLSLKFIKILEFYRNFPDPILNEEDEFKLNLFVENFLKVFCQDDFIIPESHLEKYINLNSGISELVSLSRLKNTDKQIAIILDNQPENFAILPQNKLVKVLTLFSIRNKITINYELLFQSGPEASTLWYWEYLSTTCFYYEHSQKNIENHLENIGLITEKTNVPIDLIHLPFFNSTYGSQDKDKIVKNKINKLIKSNFPVKINNFPEKKKIGIISGFFSPVHSVYKGLFQFIKSLEEDYDLTLINLANDHTVPDARLFTKIINIRITGNTFDLAGLNENRFSLVFYPEVGMSPESVLLSNLRLAPVQVTGLGHSVSTFGSEIDYFISGIDSELINKANDNYSERLVLIPGTGLHTVKQVYTPQNIFNKSDKFIIACPWAFMKINYNHLQNLLRIKSLVSKKIIFRFFPAFFSNISLIDFKKNIEVLFGHDNVEVIESVPYEKYMELFEEADLAFDSYHFGGYNTIINALYLKKPVITLEGEKAYNRFAAVILKQMGLPELVANNESQFVEKAVELIINDTYRETVINRIKSIDPEKILFSTESADFFKKAISFLIENNEKLKAEGSYQPIIIN
jgi:hypothetical protein